MTDDVAAIGEWAAAITPIAEKLEVGAKFGEQTVFNRDGSAALAKLMRDMARIIDTEIALRQRLKGSGDDARAFIEGKSK